MLGKNSIARLQICPHLFLVRTAPLSSWWAPVSSAIRPLAPHSDGRFPCNRDRLDYRCRACHTYNRRRAFPVTCSRGNYGRLVCSSSKLTPVADALPNAPLQLRRNPPTPRR
ncbi:uncharacterized protein LOC115628452 [Scaptodrosophila lebanonensis]|uniref:Uncharacterized protein LOC115628452 n=1 Tax=Drosophila lebanonensis TaxID=7225 RepID=A0A6J2TWA4_DROLE|nr:uncharacterized protein LOC115628452 [Scaptodrosophila lebanonensis]